MLAKRLVNLNIHLERIILKLTAKQSDFSKTKAFKDKMDLVNDNKSNYKEYLNLTLENLNNFIAKRVKLRKPYHTAIE